MCLITFNWLDHPKYKLILVANRDEYYDRPSAPVHLWKDGFIAGKDLKEGGAWLGLNLAGRFAAVTNYRDYLNEKEDSMTRGGLVKRFLKEKISPLDYLKKIREKKWDYNGFNLLVADKNEMYYFSNYRDEIIRVNPGLHGISNAFLDTPWQKVTLAKKEFSRLLQNENISVDDLLAQLQSRKPAPEILLPDTGLPLHLEKAVSAQFIKLEDYYGTVNTTALIWKNNGEVVIKEKKFIPEKLETTVKFFIKH